MTIKNLLSGILMVFTPFIDLIKLIRSCIAFPAFICDIYRYMHLPGAEPLRNFRLYPILHEKTHVTSFDAHYVYLGEWAFRNIVKSETKQHVDVGSQISWVTCLATITNVIYIDIRPFIGEIENLESRAGSILKLPFRDREVHSLSSLHVAEHIGLGRYGDPLDPSGTRKAIHELSRVIADGGKLYFGLPIGKPRVFFNAHRIHAPEDIVKWFAEEGIALESFSAVDDEGNCQHNVPLANYKNSRYACGMYVMVRK